MKIAVLATGSKGNCTYIETQEHKILIDIGTTSLYAEKKLKQLEIDPKNIDSIFITHTHIDHINGLKVFLKKYNPTVFLTSKMHDELASTIILNNYYLLEEDIVIDDLYIKSFKTSHDVGDSNGYIFESNNKRIVYITDTGYINVKYHKMLTNQDFYVMESNHDVKMLMDGTYPYYLKQRIVGDKGHLSNYDSANYLASFVGDKTKGIILIHLSEDNNDPKLAYDTLANTLAKRNKKVNNIIISKQRETTELIEI